MKASCRRRIDWIQFINSRYPLTPPSGGNLLLAFPDFQRPTSLFQDCQHNFFAFSSSLNTFPPYWSVARSIKAISHLPMVSFFPRRARGRIHDSSDGVLVFCIFHCPNYCFLIWVSVTHQDESQAGDGFALVSTGEYGEDSKIFLTRVVKGCIIN